ncbi:MAG: trypsin-like peptidase domain-containing protein [Firmicutes bacterium]|nr:trypsin-like peptidase domain-containing protein [Bacillota bacterium]
MTTRNSCNYKKAHSIGAGLKNSLISGVFFLLMILVSGAMPSYAAKQMSEEEKLIQAIGNVKPCVVNIQAVGVRPGGDNFVETGSGIVIKKNGYILTNYHVVKDAKDITVTIFNGKKIYAVIAGKSPRDDIAVIKIGQENMKVPKWGNSKNLKIGQVAVAIGNPYKFDWSVSRGIISALNRRLPAQGTLYVEMIQTDAAINPGSSGGALMDSSGRVIGVNTLVYTGSGGHNASGLGFAIPIHRALKISNMLMANKVLYDPKPWIGIAGKDITQELAEAYVLPVQMGVMLTDVNPSGPAGEAGLRKGDIVVQCNNKQIRNVNDMKNILNNSKPGDTLKLSVWRGEKNMVITIKVSQRSVQ